MCFFLKSQPFSWLSDKTLARCLSNKILAKLLQNKNRQSCCKTRIDKVAANGNRLYYSTLLTDNEKEFATRNSVYYSTLLTDNGKEIHIHVLEFTLAIYPS